MILLKLDKKSPTPLYTQIIRQVKEMAEKDILKPGTILPSTRNMAEQLGVNRSTVTNAYQELWAQGYIDSRPGSYSRIRKRPKMARPENRQEKSAIPWNRFTSPASREIFEDYLRFRPEKPKSFNRELINMAQLDMDPRLFPTEDFRRCLNQVLIHQGSKILGYGEYMGYRPLRKTIADRLRLHGISVSPEEILITNGSQNGIELVLKLFSRPGRKTVIEAPTYSIILPLLKYYQAELVSIPMSDDGIDIESLGQAFQQHDISFIYTIPNFQNPTGITSTQRNREQLMSLCEAHGIPIVEDGFEEEMKYHGMVPPPIKSMDKSNICIYLGTFSKVLFPGIRIGWIAAERECIQRILAIKRFSDLTSSFVLQAAINEFCHRGYYDRHIKRMHRIFRGRMQTAIQCLHAHLSDPGISWNDPSGGYLIWIKIQHPFMDEDQMLDIFEKYGVMLSPGKYYFHRTPRDRCFRLSISTLNEGEIQEGIKRLKQAVSDIRGR